VYVLYTICTLGERERERETERGICFIFLLVDRDEVLPHNPFFPYFLPVLGRWTPGFAFYIQGGIIMIMIKLLPTGLKFGARIYCLNHQTHYHYHKIVLVAPCNALTGTEDSYFSITFTIGLRYLLIIIII
jgi:hypothetical protein